MRRRTRESSETDKPVSSHFFLKPRTVIHFFLVIVHTVVFLLGACYNNWPRFCIGHNWAYFSVIGLHVSAMINIISTFVTYIIFEDLNWVLISTLLFVYGAMFSACGALFMWDDIKGCGKCRLPVLRVFKENLDKEWMKWTPRLLENVAYTPDSIEATVAYSTLILGLLYLLMLSYYVARRENA